jgi:predicted nucleotidyltransferase
MDEFYNALKVLGLDEMTIEMVRKVLVEQEIDVMQLGGLTDSNLKKDGLVQLGLRKAVLEVIENRAKGH